MKEDATKLEKAKVVLEKMANGINPVDGSKIKDSTFLEDERIVRCLIFVSEVLGRVIEVENKKGLDFSITEEEKKRIVLPEWNIGVNQFSKCVNTVIDTRRTSKLSGVELNRQLKKMGLLADGKDKRTTLMECSSEYGIEIEIKTLNSREYESVVFNEKGKKYLIENLEMIMNY